MKRRKARRAPAKEGKQLAQLPLPPAAALSALDEARLDVGGDDTDDTGKWWVIGGVAAAAVGLGALIWWLSSRKSEPTQPQPMPEGEGG